VPRKLSRIQRLLTTAGLAVVAAAALPGSAQAADCPVSPTTRAFEGYGDANSYFLAPGGAFGSLEEWSRRGWPTLVSGIDLLGLSPESRSADLDYNEGVTSVSFCVDSTMPHLRFNARYIRGGQLDVTVQTVHGTSTNTNSGSIAPDDHRAWAPSRNVGLGTAGIPAGESGTATVSFRSQGDWQLDDVYIDPYRR
jgi:hypothetical protein